MDPLFINRMQQIGLASEKISNSSRLMMEKSFSRDKNYRVNKLYDRHKEYLETVEYKFQKVKDFSLAKDKSEFWVQFRSDFFPEKKYPIPIDEEEPNVLPYDAQEAMGFYLDVIGADKTTHSWMLLDREDRNDFCRYLALECNWLFGWIDKNGIMHRSLGVLRERNNYNSGVWSDGTTTTIENQIQFFVPYNDETKSITYDTRFVVSKNRKYPRVWRATKVEDTFPVGVIKVTCSQVHSEYNDVNTEGIAVPHYEIRDTEQETAVVDDKKHSYKATLSCSTKKLMYKGSPLIINSELSDEYGNKMIFTPTWRLGLVSDYYIHDDNVDWYSFEDFEEYFKIEVSEDAILLSYPQSEDALVGQHLAIALEKCVTENGIEIDVSNVSPIVVEVVR